MKVYPHTTREMASLLRERLPFIAEWDRDKLLAWVQWFINVRRYYALSRGGKLVGLALVRFVDTEEQCEEHYRDTGGPICYIEATVSTEDGGMAEMFRMMWEDAGKFADKIAWVRHKYGNRIVVNDMDKAKRRFMRN